MGSYGRNFEFRKPPRSRERDGRFVAPLTGAPIPIGAPVVADFGQALSTLGLQPIRLATTGDAAVSGSAGVAVFEYGPAAFAGYDPFLTTYSDLDAVPAGRALQVIHGNDLKVVFTNTVAELFLGVRTYQGRTMVAGMGATPTVALGNFLVPGTGNDTDGYWEVQAGAAGAWMQITGIDTVRNQVEATLLF